MSTPIQEFKCNFVNMVRQISRTVNETIYPNNKQPTRKIVSGLTTTGKPSFVMGDPVTTTQPTANQTAIWKAVCNAFAETIPQGRG